MNKITIILQIVSIQSASRILEPATKGHKPPLTESLRIIPDDLHRPVLREVRVYVLLILDGILGRFLRRRQGSTVNPAALTLGLGRLDLDAGRIVHPQGLPPPLHKV